MDPNSPLPRPSQHLVAAGRHYETAWRQVDLFREAKGKRLPDWPDWCFLPMAGFYTIVSESVGLQKLDAAHAHLAPDVGRLAALGSWRPTQGIYRFDPALAGPLLDTPLDDQIPVELLQRLPEWCVYVETPGHVCSLGPIHGFFAHLEWDANTGRQELRFLLDGEQALHPLALHVGRNSLDASIGDMLEEAALQGRRLGLPGAPAPEDAESIRTLVSPLLNLVLYLCSTNAEIGLGPKPEKPTPVRTKNGVRLFPPHAPRVWPVGARLGAALRVGRLAGEGDAAGETGTGVRPHVRRAHWHTYRVGPGRAQTALKWLPPIPVNVHRPEDLAPTIRPVPADEGGPSPG